MTKEMNIFDFQAAIGVTKHLGSRQATDELVSRCGISKESYVLDIGCGVGQTAVYLAQSIGCRVMGIDVLAKMVTRTRERVAKNDLQHLVDARIADAQALPFEDDTFDAVITESVMAFPPDKVQAMRELVRVCRPGGRVGLNETTWMQTPVPDEMAAWVAQELSSDAVIFPEAGWRQLLLDAGLTDIRTCVNKISGQRQALDTIKRYGWGYIFKVWGRTLSVYRNNPDYRVMLKKVQDTPMPKDLFAYFGYGIYVGTKLVV